MKKPVRFWKYTSQKIATDQNKGLKLPCGAVFAYSIQLLGVLLVVLLRQYLAVKMQERNHFARNSNLLLYTNIHWPYCKSFAIFDAIHLPMFSLIGSLNPQVI